MSQIVDRKDQTSSHPVSLKEISAAQPDKYLIKTSLDQGYVADSTNRKLFFRPIPMNWKEYLRLEEDYPLDTDEVFCFHVTALCDLSLISDSGLVATSESPTVSFDLTDAEIIERSGVLSWNTDTLTEEQKKQMHPVVTVWKAPKAAFQQKSFETSPIAWPIEKYKGSRTQLPDRLKDAEDLRYLPPKYLIGFYLLDYENGYTFTPLNPLN